MSFNKTKSFSTATMSQSTWDNLDLNVSDSRVYLTLYLPTDHQNDVCLKISGLINTTRYLRDKMCLDFGFFFSLLKCCNNFSHTVAVWRLVERRCCWRVHFSFIFITKPCHNIHWWLSDPISILYTPAKSVICLFICLKRQDEVMKIKVVREGAGGGMLVARSLIMLIS